MDVYNSMLHCCAQAGDLNRAVYHLERMRCFGLKPTRVSYHSVLNACAAAKDPVAAVFWFSELESAGIDANIVTYGTVCKAFARQGQIQEIRGLMQSMSA